MRRMKLSEREVRNAIALHEQGCSNREIAKRLQRSPTAISRLLADRKLTGVQAEFLPEGQLEAVQRTINWEAWNADEGQDEPEATTTTHPT